MAVTAPAIQLCKAMEFVCQWMIMIFQISGSLWPAVDELKEGLFVFF